MNKTPVNNNKSFGVLLLKIKQAQQKAFTQVNTTLIELYWEVGKVISQKVSAETWGKGVVKELATYIKQNEPEIKGFSNKNLWRMKQFYETYKNDEKLSALTRQLPWTHNTIIFSRCKTPQERVFYMNLCILEKYASRELERQIKAALFETSGTQKPKLSAVLRELHPSATTIFKDNYTLEFLGKLTDLLAPLELGWKDRSVKEQALMENFSAFIIKTSPRA